MSGRRLLSDWAVSGITIVQSGSPFSVTDSGAGTAFLGAGFTPGTLTGSLASGATLASGLTSGSIGQRVTNGYLNPTAFTPAAVLYPAQCLVNNQTIALRASAILDATSSAVPGQQNWDFSLIKNFKLTERQSLRFTSRLFQPLEPRQLRESDGDRRGRRKQFWVDHEHGGDAAAHPVLVAVRFLGRRSTN